MEGNSIPSEKDCNQDYYKQCLDAIARTEKDFNKTLTYIVSGAFTISVYFAKNMDIKLGYLLVAAWAFFATAIIINFSSHLYSISVTSKAMDIDDDEKKRYDYVEKANSRIMQMNIGSLVLTVFGIFFLLVFMANSI